MIQNMEHPEEAWPLDPNELGAHLAQFVPRNLVLFQPAEFSRELAGIEHAFVTGLGGG